jgi:hypothetical protein
MLLLEDDSKRRSTDGKKTVLLLSKESMEGTANFSDEKLFCLTSMLILVISASLLSNSIRKTVR